MSTFASSRPGRPRRTRYHHGDLRRALIDAALDLVRRRGLDGFTLREAARRVGVSQAAPYRHFSSKDELLAAVAEEGFHALSRRLKDAGADAGSDPSRRLRAQGLASFEFYVADPARFRVMFGPVSAQKGRYPALAEAWQRVNALLLDSLIACQRAGFIRPGDPVEIGLTTASLVHGLASLVIDGHLGEEPARGGAAAVDIYRRARATLYRGLHPDGMSAVPEEG